MKRPCDHRDDDDSASWDADDDAWDEEDQWIDEEADDEEEEPTVACPYCREPIHEDSQRCPHCGSYISREDAPAGGKPWWLIVGVAVSLYVVFRWITG